MARRSSSAFIGLQRAAWELSRAAIQAGRRMFVVTFGCVWAVIVGANALIDTGAILALLDRTDRWHGVCIDAFRQLRLPLGTSEAVLTEVFHLVGDSRKEMEAAWKFVRSGALLMLPIDSTELPQIHTLMSRYWDRPMDFADATLVHLAKRESLSTVFTVDLGDFETYRIDGRRRFRVLPAKRPLL
jgi:predicted nucleic acid-binding protein